MKNKNLHIKSIQKIVEYLYEDEAENYDMNGKPAGHIFKDIKRVIKWLSEQK